MKLTLKEISELCGGELSLESNHRLEINRVVIDSRVSKNNTLFIAIKGENSDGHNYVSELIQNNSIAAIVNKDSGITGSNLVYVEDTIKAMGLLAHNYRKKFSIPLIGITGSNGKTTVKEMLRSICNIHFGEDNVLATGGNLNNHLGVPLTLFNLEYHHSVAIIEMGMNHAGELDYLSKIAEPDIAVVNNVMLAHAGFFNDKSDIARAKGEIYNGITNGIACVNLDVEEHGMWLDKLQQKNTRILSYGNQDSGYYIKKNGENTNNFTLVTVIGSVELKLQVLGDHNQNNALTAAVLALNIGCDLDDIKQGLENYTGFKGRLEKKTAFNGAIVIDDSYNANPDSVKAAILSIQKLPKPHWFIFADLKELGKFAVDSHVEIGKFASDNGIDVLLTYGELAAISRNSFNGQSFGFDNLQDVIKYVLKNLPSSGTLLVKGSNSMKLNEVVRELVVTKP
jgi:UDP-N-acetylmuramoyl-tripeptide--D-alanyl-D-alanine ligase